MKLKVGQADFEQRFLSVYPQLSGEYQSALRNVLTIQKRIQEPLTDVSDINLYIDLGKNAILQIYNLYNADIPEYIKNEFEQLLNYYAQQISQIINQYSGVLPEPVNDIEITEEPVYDDIEVEELSPQEWAKSNQEKPKKKRKLTSRFLPEEVKQERERELEAQDLGLSKEEYDKVNEPIEQASKIMVSVEFPDKDEVDIDDLGNAHVVLKDREPEVPESLKEVYNTMVDAVFHIANAVDDQKAELAFMEFENVFADVVNGLSKEVPELFEDLNEWLGVIYVVAYKIAAELDISPQIDRGDDLTFQQSGGSQASYDFRKNVKEYWKKYRQGAIYKRVYDPNTKSFHVEYVGNDPKKREYVLNNSKKNLENFVNRLREPGKIEYYQRKRDLEKKRNLEKGISSNPKIKVLKDRRQKDKYYLNKLKNLATWPKENRQNELDKIENKRKKDLISIQEKINELQPEDQIEINNKINEIEKNIQEEKIKILASLNKKIFKIAELFFNCLNN